MQDVFFFNSIGEINLTSFTYYFVENESSFVLCREEEGIKRWNEKSKEKERETVKKKGNIK